MRCFGMEALLRWNHGSFGMIYPPLVIKLAQEAGILTELEEYVIKTAISDYPAISLAAGTPMKLSINIFGVSLQSQEMVEFLEKISDSAKFERGRICLEITEQTSLSMSKNTDEILLMLRSKGFIFAIDDFSMGHTSLKYLQEIHFELVKLDGSLVKSMHNNPRCRDIIKSITELAKSLNFLVLSEFVENEEEMRELEKIGCTLYQGWLYSPALPVDSLYEFLCSHECVSL